MKKHRTAVTVEIVSSKPVEFTTENITAPIVANLRKLSMNRGNKITAEVTSIHPPERKREPAAQEIDQRDELATVLAGLRMFQREIMNHDSVGHVIESYDLEGHFKNADPLTCNEIDGLCERLNSGEWRHLPYLQQFNAEKAATKARTIDLPPEPVTPILVVLCGAVVEGVYTNSGKALAFESFDVVDEESTLNDWEKASEPMKAVLREGFSAQIVKFSNRRLLALRKFAEDGPEGNGYEIPDKPERFAVVEYQEGTPIWIYNVSTLDEAAAAILSSDTEAVDDTIVWDLDTDQQHRPKMAIRGWESTAIKMPASKEADHGKG